jgi:hypothetical protein
MHALDCYYREDNGLGRLEQNLLRGAMMTVDDEPYPTSAAESCGTERSKALASSRTTSQDAYSIKQKMNQGDPFVRFQLTKDRNPQILSYNSNLAYLGNKLLDDVDREINLPMTTTSRRMNVRNERRMISYCT